MKNSEKINAIKPLIENVRLLSIGMEDIVQCGDDGWKYSYAETGKELRKYIEQINNILDPPPEEKIIKRDPEPGTQAFAIKEFADHIFAFFCREFKQISMEELMPMDRSACLVWAEIRLIETSPTYKHLYYDIWPSKGFQMLDEAYEKVVPERKKGETQTDLFDTKNT